MTAQGQGQNNKQGLIKLTLIAIHAIETALEFVLR
jgi:hypothetical protein